MIVKDRIWYDVVPVDMDRTMELVDGKWLYFGETAELHAMLKGLDELVEAGEILAAKVARKLPDFDPFPDKPCVLCVYTSDDPIEKERVKALLSERLGVSVRIWKSELQTMLDWEEGGLLQLQAELAMLKRDIASGQVADIQIAQRKLLESMRRLQNVIKDIDEPERMAELYLSSIHTLEKGIEASVLEETPSYDGVVARLEALEEMTTDILAQVTDKRSEGARWQTERAKLRQNFNAHFSTTELREICFDLGIDYERFMQEDKRVFVMDLIMYMERRGVTGHIV
jgi:hypothetical protein